MKLLDFISALKSKEVKVTLLDNDDNEIIKFYSEGFSGVEDSVLNRSVKKWSIESQTSIKVVLEESAHSESESQSESESVSESESESESESQS